MLEALSARDDFNQLLAAQATLPGKVHRQYLTRDLNAAAGGGGNQPLSLYRHPTRIAAGARYDRSV